MNIVRPVGAAVLGPIAVFAVLAAGASVAQAASYVDDASLSLDGSNPCSGDVQVIDGSGFAPGEQVVVDLLSDPVRLGAITANSDGDFTLRARVPGNAEGRHVVSAEGATSGAVATAEVDIRDCGDGEDNDNDNDNDADDQDGNDSGILPRTGAALGGAGVAGLLLIGGGLAVRRYRRRADES